MHEHMKTTMRREFESMAGMSLKANLVDLLVRWQLDEYAADSMNREPFLMAREELEKRLGHEVDAFHKEEPV